MPRDRATVLQIQLMFAGLNAANRLHVYPQAGALRDALTNLINSSSTNITIASQSVIRNFATAAVEMWHKSIHSFLISSSLTKSSPVWSSVAGYYSSHYTMRGFAHLLGYFLLYTSHKSTIKLEINNAQHLCHIKRKDKTSGEHRYYWDKVHQHPDFISDPFFTTNIESLNVSDSGHRNKANYYDHLYGFSNFQVLDEKSLKERIKVISGFPLYDAPIPRKDHYADIDHVQLIAYYRLVKFRSFLDEVLGTNHHYWSFHRDPIWSSNFIKYQTANNDLASIIE